MLRTSGFATSIPHLAKHQVDDLVTKNSEPFVALLRDVTGQLQGPLSKILVPEGILNDVLEIFDPQVAPGGVRRSHGTLKVLSMLLC